MNNVEPYNASDNKAVLDFESYAVPKREWDFDSSLKIGLLIPLTGENSTLFLHWELLMCF